MNCFQVPWDKKKPAYSEELYQTLCCQVTSIYSTSARAKELTLALTEFIAKDLRPISVVDDTGF